MPPTGRDAIQEGLASKGAERGQMSESTSEFNKLPMKERASVDFAGAVCVQGCRKDLHLDVTCFEQNWLNKQKQAQHPQDK